MSRTPNDTHPVLLYDGDCGLCSRFLQLVIRNDKRELLRFAPLRSPAGMQLLERYGLAGAGIDSIVLITREGVFLKSTAALRVLGLLRFPFSLARALRIVPRFLRDAVYDLVAANRKRFFKNDNCLIPDAKLRKRFL